MSRIFRDITETVGHTPLVRLNRLAAAIDGEILAKLEYFNPMGSLKDRIGLAMIDAAEKAGKIGPGASIIEPTSGNTGIALAFVCAARGYQLIITMPESMSLERRKLFSLLGARVVLTPGEEGMKGAIDQAHELLRREDNAFMPNQFDNPVNPEVHFRTTAEEILADTDGRVDVLVAGVGTGGSLTGLAKRLRRDIPDLSVIAVEPENSPVLSGGIPGPHRIQGIGAGFVPRVLDTSVITEVIRISDDRAVRTARRCAREEGIACGISSGAVVAAALECAARKNHRGKRFVAVLPDFAERYLSTELFEES